MRAQSRLYILYALLFAAFGALSPFLPVLLLSGGLSSEAIGGTIGAGVILRMAVAPAVGHAADARHAVRKALAAACVCSAFAAALYVAPFGGTALIMLALFQSAALAPIVPLADAAAVTAASRGGFSYGRIRGLGSAAFILGSLGAGALAERFVAAPALAQAALLAPAALAALRAPEPTADVAATAQAPRSPELLKNRAFLCIIVIFALALGSHALHDGFAMIYWTQSGISPPLASILWSESVASEVLMFFLVGPFMLRRLGERGTFALAIGAGVLRWSVMALTSTAPIMAFTEPLHGLSFALLHLAAMAVIARTVPTASAALAQSVYGALGVGAATAILSFASGILFSRLGTASFWVMAALAALALPFVFALPPPMMKQSPER